MASRLGRGRVSLEVAFGVYVAIFYRLVESLHFYPKCGSSRLSRDLSPFLHFQLGSLLLVLTGVYIFLYALVAPVDVLLPVNEHLYCTLNRRWRDGCGCAAVMDKTIAYYQHYVPKAVSAPRA